MARKRRRASLPRKVLGEKKFRRAKSKVIASLRGKPKFRGRTREQSAFAILTAQAKKVRRKRKRRR